MLNYVKCFYILFVCLWQEFLSLWLQNIILKSLFYLKETKTNSHLLHHNYKLPSMIKSVFTSSKICIKKTPIKLCNSCRSIFFQRRIILLEKNAYRWIKCCSSQHSCLILVFFFFKGTCQGLILWLSLTKWVSWRHGQFSKPDFRQVYSPHRGLKPHALLKPELVLHPSSTLIT